MKHRNIKRVAFASLVASTAGACGGASLSDDESTLASTMCQQLECDLGADFDTYYTSQAQCRTELKADIHAEMADYVDQYGAACAQAYVKYLICSERYDLAVCKDGDSNIDCDDEYDHAAKVCGF